jgi:thiol-disulfide isomerase/thioredoxin
LLNQEIVFFIQPNDHVFISAIIEKDGINYQVTGNRIGNQQNEFYTKLYPLEKELNQLTLQQEKLRKENKIEETKDINYKINLKNSQIEYNLLALIKENPDWDYSAMNLAKFPIDSISKYFKILSNDVQNSFFGMYLSKIMTASDIGSSVPEFILPNEKGEQISFCDFKGKYIVIDFWGTWCGYCMKGIPKMNDYHLKYKDKIEFINIGCRDNIQVWQKTIEKQKIRGINLFAENDEVPDKFGVVGYPTKIIIDKEGKIILKTIGESDEFYAKIDELFNK